MNKASNTGFTLIELLVVISIISLISSMVLTSVNSARAKARDVRKQADFKAITNALYLFYDKNGRMPNNYRPGLGVCQGSSEYNQSMQELVDTGFLRAIPRSPGGAGYCWYNYGSDNKIGGLMVTALETVPDTTTGIPSSCRPWSPGGNWCNQNSSKEYCICNPH